MAILAGTVLKLIAPLKALKNIKIPGMGGISGLIKGKNPTTGVAKNAPGMLSKAGTAAVGVGIVATAGFDIYSAIKSKNPVTKFKKLGQGLGTAIGGGIGFFFGGPAGAALGATIGHVAGGWVGDLTRKFSKTKLGKKIGSSLSGAFKTANRSIKGPVNLLGKTVSKSWKSVTKSFKLSKTDQKNMKAIGDVFKYVGKIALAYIGSKLRTTIKMLGVVIGTVFKVAAHIIKSIGGVFKGLSKIVKGTVGVVGSLLRGDFKGAFNSAGKVVNGFFDIWQSVWSGIWDVAKDVLGGIAKLVGTVVDGIGDMVKSLTHANDSDSKNNSHGYFTDGVLKPGKLDSKKGSNKIPAKDKINLPTGIGHANGGPINRTHVAMVNEAGTEMAYDPRKGRFRLLGNGPTLAKVHAGEHILNAKDTAKVLSGGLGKGRTLPGYAKGTGKLKVAAAQSSVSLKGSGLDGSARSAKKSMRLITSTITNGYKKSNKNGSKELNQLNSKSTKIFGSLKVGTKKQTQQIQRNTIRDFNDMQKGSVTQVKQLNKGMNSVTSDIVKDSDRNVGKLHKNTVKDFDQMQKSSMIQMNQMHKGMNAVANAMVNDFYKIFGRLDNYAHKAMAAAIKQLNGGISGINTVLNKFGGGGSVLPLIHYAQGSKGPISKHTMAVVNDAKVGPRQEAIVKPNGRVFMPQGNDVVLPLGPGDEVLNGSETAKLQDVGALPHFAKGTGGLKRLIQKNNKDPKAAWQNDFTSKAQGKVGTFLAGALSKTSKGASNKVGLPWNTEVWSQLNDALSGGGAGGNWLNSPGSGWSTGSAGQTFGSNGGRGFAHDGVDFGAALGTPFRAMHGGTVTKTGPTGWGGGALGNVITIKSDDGWQEIYQEFGSSKNIKVSVGDVVKPGQVIGTLGALQGAGSGAHLHVGVSHGSLWDHGGTSTRGWYDITKMHGKSSGTTKDNKKTKNPALTKLVKKELGNRIKWVTDKLGEDSFEGGGINLTGGLGSRARQLANWLKELYPEAKNGGIAGILGNWMQESRLSPGSINRKSDGSSDGGSGLGQWTLTRKNPMRNWVAKHYGRWNSAKGQLDYALHEGWGLSNEFKSVLRMSDPVAAARRFFSKWESGGAMDWTGNIRLSNAKSAYNAISKHANGGWAENGKVNIFGEVPGQNEVAINTSRPSADKLIMEAMSDRASKQPNGIFGQLKEFAKIQNEFKKMKLSRDDFNESVKANSVGQKAVSIKPNMNYHPEIHIEGASDPERTGDVVAKRLTEDRRKFESMANDLFSKILAAQN
ncbi:phage tail tip lysozyme [Lentilactobacillus senioris]|uniref:phage tail tip lysozyme n=1 Tax=Lentilactobacillus senioris TaxID=931534 RepID=UPI003D296F2A